MFTLDLILTVWALIFVLLFTLSPKNYTEKFLIDVNVYRRLTDALLLKHAYNKIVSEEVGWEPGDFLCAEWIGAVDEGGSVGFSDEVLCGGVVE